MKNKKETKVLLLIIIFTMFISGCWFSEPQRNETKYISLNETGYEMSVYTAYNSGFQGGPLVDRNSIMKDGGGQLDLDSIKFVVGTEIRPTGNSNSTHELVGVFDSITYVNPRHLTDEEYELAKERSFFNIENWIPEDNDFVYSVYDSDFE